jgi:hypothetical protein
MGEFWIIRYDGFFRSFDHIHWEKEQHWFNDTSIFFFDNNEGLSPERKRLQGNQTRDHPKQLTINDCIESDMTHKTS